jgi:hypothetical protein
VAASTRVLEYGCSSCSHACFGDGDGYDTAGMKKLP